MCCVGGYSHSHTHISSAHCQVYSVSSLHVYQGTSGMPPAPEDPVHISKVFQRGNTTCLGNGLKCFHGDTEYAQSPCCRVHLVRLCNFLAPISQGVGWRWELYQRQSLQEKASTVWTRVSLLLCFLDHDRTPGRGQRNFTGAEGSS